MNHLLAVLSTNGENSDYLRIIHELLIDDDLIGTMKNVSTDEAALAKIRLLESVITQWDYDTATDEETAE